MYIPTIPSDNKNTIGAYTGLAPTRWQSIICTNDGIFYWRLYASLGLDELNDHHSRLIMQ